MISSAERFRPTVTLLAALLLAAAAPAQAQSHDHAHAPAAGPYAPPLITAADREAAFPDLGDMDMRTMMIEDPFNRLVLFDQLEVRDGGIATWDFQGWVGRSAHRIWLRSEGERDGSDTDGAELQLLSGRPIARWWDVVAGVREDLEPGPSRSWAAFGIQGLAPYRFEVEATGFVGENGRTAVRVEAEYELLITNRLVLQPLVELNWYGQSDQARDIGAGLSSAETGLRLRYELRREVAPYVGLTHERTFGRTAELVRAAGVDTRDTHWVAGVRLWF